MDSRRPYQIDPETARRRSAVGGRSRTTTDYFVRKITEADRILTDEQKLQLAALLSAAGPPRPLRHRGADYHLRQLAAVRLTEGQKRQLAKLLMPFLTGGEAA
jgi:hypothetical protein